MKDKKTNLIISIVMTLVFICVLALLIYILIHIKSDGVKCINDPIIYGINKLEEVNGATVTCSCYAQKEGNPGMFFTRDSKEFIGGTSTSSYDAPNFSDLEEFIIDDE